MPPRRWIPICAGLVLACGQAGVGDDANPSDTSESSADLDAGDESSSTSESGDESETGTDTDAPPGNLLLSDQFLNIAHRGGGRLRPEATLPAFENALAVGAEVLEMDLHASADGVIVVIHDDTVDRTTDGSGAVKDMSFTELRTLDAGYAFTPDGGMTHPYRGMGIQIPTVEEVLESFPGEYYLMEIKQSEPSIVADLIELLDQQEVLDRVVIASFQQVTIDEVRALAPELMTAMTLPEMLEFYEAGENPDYVPPCEFVQSPWDLTDAALIQRSHELGLKVHPWTVNAEALMLDLIDRGVDGIMTDDPALLEAAQ